MKAEFAVNTDLIESNFIDTYYNLTLKSRSALNFFTQKCQNSKLLVLLDDDVIIKHKENLQAIQGNTDREPGFQYFRKYFRGRCVFSKSGHKQACSEVRQVGSYKGTVQEIGLV